MNTDRQILENIWKTLERRCKDAKVYTDLYRMCADVIRTDKVLAMEYLVKESELLEKMIPQAKDYLIKQLFEIHMAVLKLGARENFEMFLLYSEMRREPKNKFYPPRRKQLKPVVNELQRLADGELDLLCISMPPGTGKTTLAIAYIVWRALREPEKTILTGSHSSSLVGGMYEECLRWLNPEGDYLCTDVFGMQVQNKNAKAQWINLGDEKRFATLEFTSIGSQNAGQYRATGLLYTDDLVSGIEEAMSKDRMDKLWQAYTTDLRQRMLGEPQQLVIATRWSINDPIGRLQEMNEGNDRAKFVVMPALNEDDESNFNYAYGVGYTTEKLHEQRKIMDNASWRALYMNEPIEREGQLYAPAELKRYFELPDREPDAIIACCDTKDRGNDYCGMPVAYQYGDQFFIEHIVCDNGKVEVVDEKLVQTLLKHKVQRARFESNSAGGRVAAEVAKRVKEKGGITSIETKYTTGNKETKIQVNSVYVKEHFLFKDDEIIKDDKEYKDAMKWLTSYTMSGKNKHDDIPDVMAQLAIYVQEMNNNKIEIFKRPF